MSICIQKIKDRYQYNQEILKIKEHSNLIDSEHALVCPFQNNMLFLSFYLNPLSTFLPQISKPDIAGVDTGCFRHRYTNFEHNNLGVPKFNLK